jgi:hypothetical protein
MKNKLIIVAIFLLSACSSLKYSKENSYNSYSVKLNSVNVNVENSSFSVTPTIYGSRNEFAVISVQSFLNIEVARLLLFTDSAFLVDRINHKIYFSKIPSNSLQKFEEVLLNKEKLKVVEIPFSGTDKLYIKSENINNTSRFSIKFNAYSFNTDVNELTVTKDRISKPELPKKYEKVPFTFR